MNRLNLMLFFCFSSTAFFLEARIEGRRGGGTNHSAGGGASHVAAPRMPGNGRAGRNERPHIVSHRPVNNVTVNIGRRSGRHIGAYGRGGGRWHGRYWGYDGPYWCSWFVTDSAIAEAIALNNYARLNDGQLLNALEYSRRAVALQKARIELDNEKNENDRLRRQVNDLIDELEKEQRARRNK